MAAREGERGSFRTRLTFMPCLMLSCCYALCWVFFYGISIHFVFSIFIVAYILPYILCTLIFLHFMNVVLYSITGFVILLYYMLCVVTIYAIYFHVSFVGCDVILCNVEDDTVYFLSVMQLMNSMVSFP